MGLTFLKTKPLHSCRVFLVLPLSGIFCQVTWKATFQALEVFWVASRWGSPLEVGHRTLSIRAAQFE